MRKKKVIKIIGIILIIVLFIGIIGISCFTGISVFEGSTQLVTNDTTSLDKTSFFEKFGLDIEEFQKNYTINKVEIKSTLDGHVIPADYISVNNNPNNDTVILVHGLGGNRLTTYPVANIFLEKGYNVIAYDQRSSGENTAQYTTFGYWESKDLTDYILYAEELIDDDKKIILWGTSFGAATVGIALGDNKVNQKVDYAILDCPVSNMSYMISSEMEKMNIGIPMDFLMLMGNITTKIKLGFSYNDVNVCNYIRKAQIPILVLNSKADTVTPYFMGEEIYQSIMDDRKKIFTVDDSTHANILLDYPKEYKNEILSFIE